MLANSAGDASVKSLLGGDKKFADYLKIILAVLAPILGSGIQKIFEAIAGALG